MHLDGGASKRQSVALQNALYRHICFLGRLYGTFAQLGIAYGPVVVGMQVGVRRKAV